MDSYNESKDALIKILDTNVYKLKTVSDKKSNTAHQEISSALPGLLHDISFHLLHLQSFQRKMCLLLEEKQQLVKNHQLKLDASRLTVSNLTYERNYLLRQIGLCREYNTPELDQMVKADDEDEKEKVLVGENEGASPSSKSTREMGTSTTTTSSAALRSSCNLCYYDTSQHDANLEKINFQIHDRDRLINECHTAQLNLELTKKKLTEKQKFLSDILNQVEKVESSISPLQIGFQNWNKDANSNGNNNNNIHRKRRWREDSIQKQNKRFERAAKMPAPLYTLCCLLEAMEDVLSSSSLSKPTSPDYPTTKKIHGNENGAKQEVMSLSSIESCVSISVEPVDAKPIPYNGVDSSKHAVGDSTSKTHTNHLSKDEWNFFFEVDPTAVLLHLECSNTPVLSSFASPTARYNAKQGNSITKSTTASIPTTTTSGVVPTYVIRFQYLTNLQILTAEIERDYRNKKPSSATATGSGTNIAPPVAMTTKFTLSHLIPGDSGKNSPNLMNYHLVANSKNSDEKTDQTKKTPFPGIPSNMNALPFYWTQWLGGLLFLPLDTNDTNHYNQKEESQTTNLEERINLQPRESKQHKKDDTSQKTQLYTASIVQHLQRRIWYHTTLEYLLEIFAKNPDPIPIHAAMPKGTFPSNYSSNYAEDDSSINNISMGRQPYDRVRMIQWKNVSFDKDIPQHIKNQFTAEADEHGSSITTNTIASPSPTGWSRDYNPNRYFCATLQHTVRSSSPQIHAYVEISPEYPIRAPRWRLWYPATTASKASLSFPSDITQNTVLINNNYTAVEKRVNTKYMEELVLMAKATDESKEKKRLEEETLAWVLAHQLRMIVACCEVSMNNYNLNSSKQSPQIVGRVCRGRDRKKVKVFDT